jgi:hypothetical protein
MAIHELQPSFGKAYKIDLLVSTPDLPDRMGLTGAKSRKKPEVGGGAWECVN